ncbi:unnamed protein product [Auanema sp. JU1783]|nr:unnamed protein product [Auanema sp. JU1783]
MIFSILLFVTAFVTGGHGFGLSSHVLDISTGIPAQNFQIILSYNDNDSWKQINGSYYTDIKGRVEFSVPNQRAGQYKLFFNTGEYYCVENTFFPFIEIVFNIVDMSAHYHVPITLSPYGFSTYKGSN